MRRWLPSFLLRARRQDQRQAEEAANAESDYQRDFVGPVCGFAEETADQKLEDLAVERAPALACGRDKDRYLFRAQKPIRCHQCKREIQPGEVFSSLFFPVPVAVDFGDCSTCRPVGKEVGEDNDQVSIFTKMTPTAPNPYQTAARMKKALGLLEAVHRCGLTVERVERMTDEHWGWLALEANVKLPSAETRAMVIDSLKRGSVR